jgi:hypothetical protein
MRELRRMVWITKNNGSPYRFTLSAMIVLKLLGRADKASHIGVSSVMYIDEASDAIYWGNTPLYERVGKGLIKFIFSNVEPEKVRHIPRPSKKPPVPHLTLIQIVE